MALPRQSTKQSEPSRGNVVAEIVEPLNDLIVRDLDGAVYFSDDFTEAQQVKTIMEAADRLSQAEKQGKQLRSAAAKLLALKAGPRDDAYHAQKDAAWRALFDAMGGQAEHPLDRLERRHLEALEDAADEIASSRELLPFPQFREDLREARDLVRAALDQEQPRGS